MRIPVVSRLMISTGINGDVLYEHIWSWSFSTLSGAKDVAITEKTTSSIAENKSRYKSEAVSSMLKVLSQISKELGEKDVSFVRYTANSSSSSLQSLQSSSQHSTQKSGRISSSKDVQKSQRINTQPSGTFDSLQQHHIGLNNNQADTHSVNSFHSLSQNHLHHRSKTRREKYEESQRTSKDLILIEERTDALLGGIFLTVQDNVDFTLVEHFDETCPGYKICKEFLRWTMETFKTRYQDKLKLLPQTLRERRSDEEDEIFNQFYSDAFHDFSTLVLQQFEDETWPKLQELKVMDECKDTKVKSRKALVSSNVQDSMRTKSATPIIQNFNTLDSNITRADDGVSKNNETEDGVLIFSHDNLLEKSIERGVNGVDITQPMKHDQVPPKPAF